MKKEYWLIIVVLAFLGGFTTGVIYTVIKQEKKSQKQIQVFAPPESSSVPKVMEDIKKLKKHLKEKPNDEKGWIELGNIFFDLDRPNEAIEAYKNALKINSKNPDVITDLGIMYRRAGKFDKSVEMFKKAAKLDPKHLNSRLNLGIVLFHDKGDVDGAIKAWEEYVKIAPNNEHTKAIKEIVKKLKAQQVNKKSEKKK
ncbi:MAG: tetratricopeptide repeat protein [Deltaproteobacteria bacterium]|nr:tetratricopeptide repeat protein [Deltaproteobacteria bacterium]